MADFTDKITLKRDIYDSTLRLSDERFGRFVRALFSYAFDGMEPSLDDDETLDVLMRSHLDDFKSSVEYHRKKAACGQLGGRPKGTKKTTQKTTRKPPEKPPENHPENHPKSVSKYVSNLLTVESGGAHDERAATTTINQDSDDHDAEFKAYLELMDSDGDEPRDGE